MMVAAPSDTQPPLFVPAGAVLASADLVHVLVCTADRMAAASGDEALDAAEEHANALAALRTASEFAGEARTAYAVDTTVGCPCGQVARP